MLISTFSKLSVNVTELRLTRSAVMDLCFLAQPAFRTGVSETARFEQFTSGAADQTARTAAPDSPVTSPAAIRHRGAVKAKRLVDNR